MKTQKVIFNLYNFLWTIALPFLKRSSAFKKSYDLRISPNNYRHEDIWMHGASVGEAFVAIEILKDLKPSGPLKILYTATTAQGMGIMNSFSKTPELHSNISLIIEWFPFDKPDIMEKVILRINPKVMVLLETEIWPSHLYMLKKHSIKAIIINARLSAKSFSRYLKTKFIWQGISPGKILATSVKDAERYKKIFDSKTEITTMPNIKFDSIPADETFADNDRTKALSEILSMDQPLSIIASIRKEEENHLYTILKHLIQKFPDQIIAIFPKHIQRKNHIADILDNLSREFSDIGLKWRLRSEINNQVNSKTIILWDTFGELKYAYSFSTVAFVGGSLEPLGGQNFLEPLVCGAATVTGQYLNSFKWIEKDIFESQLVFKAQNAEQVGEFMVKQLKNPPDRRMLIKKSLEYIQKNQGGTGLAIKEIMNYIR